jgi:hypothetical protein
MNILTRILHGLRAFVPGPGIFLLLIAPVTGAVLTGLTPPSHLSNLFPLLALCILYGGGAIICREFTLYWGKGWPTLLLLGAAFGVIDEGLINKSFFDPHWPYLGTLATYGRWEGVNWVWSVQQIVLHAVFSIILPVVIVGLIFPGRQRDRWAGPRSLLVLLVLFALAVILGFFFGSSYHAPLYLYAGALGLAVILVLLARFMPRNIRLPGRRTATSPMSFAFVGLLGTAVFFLLNWFLPLTHLPFWGAIPISLAVALITMFALLFMSGSGAGWRDTHKMFLVSSALLFFIVLAPFIEIFQRQRDPGGLTVVALATLGLLYLLLRRVLRREKQQQPPLPQQQMTQVR